VRLSDRRVLRALLTAGGVREEQLPDAYQAIDKIERMDQVALASQLSGSGLAGGAIERVFAIARLRGWDAVRGALDESAEGTEAAAPLARTIAALDAMGLGAFIDVDLTIVRGLAYYTGTVFEIFDARGEMRAICGGGRYDDLLAALGGVELPALGFGMGDVVLGDLLRARGLAPGERSTIDVFVAAVTPEDLTEALSVAHALRDAGFRAEYALGTQRLDKQLKLADARDARFAIVVGPDERKRGEVVLRNLDDKAQSSVALDEVVAALAAAMRGGNGRIQDAAGSRGTNG